MLVGFAAGQICRPSAAGTERPLPAVHNSGAGTAGGAEAVPGGQAEVEVQVPEQASLVKPAALPYVPTGQGRQAAAPAKEKVPGEHRTQASMPLWPQVPAGQMVQPPEGEPTYPAAQLVQAACEVLPARLPVERPSGHDVQPEALSVPEFSTLP